MNGCLKLFGVLLWSSSLIVLYVYFRSKLELGGLKTHELASTPNLGLGHYKKTGSFSLFNLQHQSQVIKGVDGHHSSPHATDMPLSPWIVHHGGPISPFHPSGTYEPPRKESDCRVVQVHQLQRHGSRYPTSKVNRQILKTLGKLRDASDLDESLGFLSSYHYRLGESSLIPLGASESFQAGLQFTTRYSHLIEPKDHHHHHQLPFIRASLSQRVVDSATNFSAGLLSHLHLTKPDSITPLLISEVASSNNTLDNNACPNRKSNGESRKWLKIFASPITQKLNSLAKNVGLNNNDTVALMQLCIFESLSANQLSQFCQFFEQADWTGFEYYFDLDKYHAHGVGNSLAKLEGLGYISELLSRLTGDRKWVEYDESKVNQTLDQSDLTFPLDRNCYVDFSHDNQMISILAALGLMTKESLPVKGLPPTQRDWNVSKWMPFASRLTVEKLACDSQDQQKIYVRFFLNDVPMRPGSCDADERAEPELMCPLERFLESQESSIKQSGVLYKQCFADSRGS